MLYLVFAEEVFNRPTQRGIILVFTNWILGASPMKLCPSCKNTYPDDYQVCPRDQTQLTVLGSEIVPGTLLRGKYEVISELGAGGMATVYKARHQAFHDFVAVKVVHAHFMHDSDFVKRFRNEAIVARQLRHPNAVRIDDFDYTEDGRPFIVMEFVDGSSLYEVRNTHPGPWPTEHCLNIVAQVAEALGAAHALGIVHRDIKPSNIILLRNSSGEGQVKVLDFGIAKVSNGSFDGMTSVLTQQSLIIGTPEYMSPEQTSGRIESSIDGRADLYSLGLILYEMLTGSHPFRADTPMEMLIHQLNTQPPPPESLGVDVTPAVSALVLKALQKGPQNRFQSAAEMLTALGNPDSWYAARDEVASANSLSKQDSSFPASFAQNSLLPAAEKTNPRRPETATIAPVQKRRITLGVAATLIVIIAVALLAHRFLPTPKQAPLRQSPPQATVPTSAQPKTQPPPASSDQVTVSKPAGRKQREPKPAEPHPEISKENTQQIPEAKPTPVAPAPATNPEVVEEVPIAPEPKADPDALLKQAIALIHEEKYNEAFPLSKSACEVGSLAACVNLGYLFENGKGTPQNYDQAIALFRRGCDGGNALGCSNLGDMYEHSRGVPLDFNKAFVLYGKSCDGGNSHGCSNLGRMYETGKGVTPDYTQAAAAYHKACDGGFLIACSNLGYQYENGRGTPQDYGKAVALYSKSCDGGNPQGCSNLGRMYETGKGVKRDYKQAAVFFRKGCDGANAHSCSSLGSMLVEGKGASRNYVQAAPLFLKSCDGGYAPGCANLAFMYQTGQGVPRDNVQANSFYRKSCELGFQAACSKIGPRLR